MVITSEEVIIKGYPICRGIGIGKPFFLNRQDFTIFEMNIPSSQTSREIERFRNAIAQCQQDIKRLQKQLETESAHEAVMILEAQLEMLNDPLLTSKIEHEILSSKKNAEFIFQQVILEFQNQFKSKGDPFFNERFNDLEDIARRIFCYLHESGHSSLSNAPVDSIICSPEITASDAASAQLVFVKAFLTEGGGTTTHAAIVAKAKGIPYLANISLQAIKENNNQNIIVDGISGKVILNPSDKTLREYALLQESMKDQINAMQEEAKWPAETYDGFSVRLSCNVDMIHEIDTLHQFSGEGIGLFRSEYIFLPKNTIPSEEEQFQIYSEMIRKMKNLPVVIRTFDIGGDKTPINESILTDKHAFIGTRSTRFLLNEKKLFKAQLKAILRASVDGNVRILLPMIATIAELREAKTIIQEVREELKLFHPVLLGCMIEVPSAALMIDHIAKECDFLSIGTNDLIQYALAIDRGDHATSTHEPIDPSVIRLIKSITNAANREKIAVSICGEIASDPRFTALLLGLEIQELSVSPLYLPLIKNVIRRTSIIDAVQLAEKAMELKSSQEIMKLLMDNYIKSFPNDLMYQSSLN